MSLVKVVIAVISNMVPTNVIPGAMDLLLQSKEPILVFLHLTGVGGALELPRKRHLFVYREPPFGHSSLPPRRLGLEPPERFVWQPL